MMLLKNMVRIPLRLYEMFMGPLEASKPWSEQGVEGSRKWLERVYRLIVEKW